MHSLHGYSDEFAKNLRTRGYDVTYYPHSSKVPKRDLSTKDRIIRRLARRINTPTTRNVYYNLEKRYYSPRIIDRISEFDLILSIGGCCSKNFLKLITENASAKKALYIWDDLKFDKTSQSLIEYFDEVYSYSEADAELYQIKYVPNFFLDAFKYRDEPKDIDIFYIGSMREKERLETLHIIDTHTENYKKILKLHGKPAKIKLRLSPQEKNLGKYLSTKPLNMHELSAFYKRSRVLIDIPISGQQGLGLRPFEAIGSKCKLLSTNADIKRYDFYNRNNIFVLNKDFSNISQLEKWIESPYEEYPAELYLKYSIDGFINQTIASPLRAGT